MHYLLNLIKTRQAARKRIPRTGYTYYIKNSKGVKYTGHTTDINTVLKKIKNIQVLYIQKY